MDFHIVRDSASTPASRFHTDTLLETNQPGQAGFPLRTLEAAYFGKKLITNNVSVKTTPLFHPGNIFVIDIEQPWETAALGVFLNTTSAQ